MTSALTPALSPEEKETRSAAAGKLATSPYASQFIRVDGPKLNARRACELAPTRTMWLPLPRGEGWGEGGRVLKSLLVRIKFIPLEMSQNLCGYRCLSVVGPRFLGLTSHRFRVGPQALNCRQRT